MNHLSPGFGNLSPRTWYGQLFSVCYALVGIPMFGILLAGVGDHMGTVLRRAVAKIETLFLVRLARPNPEPAPSHLNVRFWWRVMKTSGGRMRILGPE